MTQIKDLTGWPPQPGGAFKPGEAFPISSEQVVIERVIRVNEGHILFACRYKKDRIEYYDLFVPDEKTGEKVAKILAENIGTRLFDIGMMEIPPDET